MQLHPALLNTLANEVITNVNMLTAIVEDGVLTESDGGLIVNLQISGAGFLPFELCEETRQPYTLSGCCRCGNVLCFTGR